MTDEEKEIRDSERRVMAECRRLRRETNKKLLAMTSEELHEYWRKGAEELRAAGYNVI
jgi:hypothetical protein